MLFPTQKEWLANLLDPFGFRPESIASKYMTVDEKNHAAAPLQGAFLLNRIIWVSIALLVLILSYFKFSFSAKKQKVKKESKASLTSLIPTTQYQQFTQNSSTKFSWTQFFHLLKFETKSIIKNPTFIIIAILGLMNMSASLTSFTGRYGGSQYPVTYDVIDAITVVKDDRPLPHGYDNCIGFCTVNYNPSRSHCTNFFRLSSI